MTSTVHTPSRGTSAPVDRIAHLGGSFPNGSTLSTEWYAWSCDSLHAEQVFPRSTPFRLEQRDITCVSVCVCLCDCVFVTFVRESDSREGSGKLHATSSADNTMHQHKSGNLFRVLYPFYPPFMVRSPFPTGNANRQLQRDRPTHPLTRF